MLKKHSKTNIFIQCILVSLYVACIFAQSGSPERIINRDFNQAICAPVRDEKTQQYNSIRAGNDANLQGIAGIQMYISLGESNGNTGLFKRAVYLPV